MNRTCSDNENFDKRCNDLEKWLTERGYNEKIIRKQISREHSRNDLREREKPQMSEQKLTFNISYYPVFKSVRAVMEELHILLTPNNKHKKAFFNVLVIGFGMARALRISKSEQHYPILMRTEDVNHVGKKLFSL